MEEDARWRSARKVVFELNDGVFLVVQDGRTHRQRENRSVEGEEFTEKATGRIQHQSSWPNPFLTGSRATRMVMFPKL